jgi:hypothetical protein
MIRLFYIFILLFQPVRGADIWTQESRDNELDQIAIWRDNLNKSSELSDVEVLKELSLGLINMGYRIKEEGHSKDVDKLFYDLQKRFLSIPRYAQYFADQIKQEQDSVKGIKSETNSRNIYDAHRASYFNEILIYLPSPQTVRVLGEFLEDDLDYESTRREYTRRGFDIKANSDYAMEALIGIELKNSPLKERTQDPDKDIITWRSWYAKVKAGTLTFSFIGDSTEYDLNGPATKEKIQRISHDRQRDQHRTDGFTKAAHPTGVAVDTPARSERFLFLGIVGLGVLAVIPTWYFLRRRGLKRMN